MKLHVLDGTYELFRAYFAFPSRAAPDGREVGAVYGLVETTMPLLRDPDVTHIAVATDTIIRSFRNDLFAGYKTEAGVDAELLAQFQFAEDMFEALGITVWRMREFEADDAMATAASRFADKVEQVVLLSPDKDLAQCVVGERVVTFNRQKQTMMDGAGVWERFGVGPASIPDYLGLVGDTADGIPGIKRWGAKSASTLLARYTHIEDIPPDEADWDVTVRGARGLGERLRDHLDDALFYRSLATLRRDVPLTEELTDLEWRGLRRDVFASLCADLGFEGLRERWLEGEPGGPEPTDLSE